jgi:SnoaL-like protein
MRLLPRVFLSAVLLLSACATTPPAGNADPAAAEQQIRQRVDSLLYRYAENDQPGVVALLDTERFVILGSDLAETVRTPEQLRSLMSRDFEQWGKASYSDVRDVDIRVDGNLATAYFVLTWSVGKSGPTLPIRLCTTWRKVNGEWLLTQSANAVLTQR